MRGSGFLFVPAFFVWCALNWIPDIQHGILGLGVAALVAYAASDLSVAHPHRFRHPLEYLWFLCIYTPIFVWECFKANLDVAYRVSRPELPINPGIVRIRTRLKTDVAITLLANSITLTPGTMTVDVDTDNGILYVHWIDVKSRDVEEATKRIAGRFEPILQRFFE